jgi:hypothetical protein
MRVSSEEILRSALIGRTLVSVEGDNGVDKPINQKIVNVEMVFEIPPEIVKLSDAFLQNPLVTVTIPDNDDEPTLENRPKNELNPSGDLAAEIIDLMDTDIPTKVSGIILKLENGEQIFVESIQEMEIL